MTANETPWPSRPYKGLQYYGTEDARIYAGRDDEIVDCARQIASSWHHITILHGTTGSGKSSFLRAGLIPFLERHEHAFQFPRHQNARADVMFIRSTGAPLLALADGIYEFARRDQTVETLLGPETLSLQPALLGHDELAAFRADAGTHAERMVESLTQLASALPRTLVLVIDQAEEVHTLSTDSAKGSAAIFFQALARLSRTPCDLKLVISLRTEFFGRFRNELRRKNADLTAVADYMLYEIDHAALIKAINHPAQSGHYNFSFDINLVARIAGDLLRTTPSGGALPAMQIVCSALYERAKRKDTVDERKDTVDEIMADHYKDLGAINDQIGRYVDAILMNAVGHGGAPWATWPLEIRKWRGVLHEFCHVQADGSVTTKLLPPDKVLDRARRLACRGSIDAILSFLADDAQRILRIIGAADPADVRYSLGHDVIGLVLLDQRVQRESTGTVLQRALSGQATVVALASSDIAHALKLRLLVLLIPFIRLKELREDHLHWLWLTKNPEISRLLAEKVEDRPFMSRALEPSAAARPDGTEAVSEVRRVGWVILPASALISLCVALISVTSWMSAGPGSALELSYDSEGGSTSGDVTSPDSSGHDSQPESSASGHASCDSKWSCFQLWSGACGGEYKCLDEDSWVGCKEGRCVTPPASPGS